MYGHVCETGGTAEGPPCLPLNVSRLRIYFEYINLKIDQLRKPFDHDCNTPNKGVITDVHCLFYQRPSIFLRGPTMIVSVPSSLSFVLREPPSFLEYGPSTGTSGHVS